MAHPPPRKQTWKASYVVIVLVMVSLLCGWAVFAHASQQKHFNCLTREVWTAEKVEYCCAKDPTRGPCTPTDAESASSNGKRGSMFDRENIVVGDDEESSGSSGDSESESSSGSSGENKNNNNNNNEDVNVNNDDEPRRISDTIEYFKVPTNKAEVMLEYPAETSAENPPRGIVFLAHGCSHSATDFWPKSEKCPECFGLPEERRIVKEVVHRRRFVAVAISSVDRTRSRCWSHNDAELVAEAIQYIRQHYHWENLPLFAIGASSGGAFVGAMLPKAIPDLKGINVQIMALHYGLDRKLKMEGLPPAIFTYMSRDSMTAQYVQRNIQAWKEASIPVKSQIAEPLPLSPSFFSDRIEGVDAVLSEAIFAALKHARLINGDGHLLGDPRDIDWRTPVRRGANRVLKTDNLVPDQSAISEELNVAWAMHEFVSDYIGDTMTFFEDILSGKVKSGSSSEENSSNSSKEGRR